MGFRIRGKEETRWYRFRWTSWCNDIQINYAIEEWNMQNPNKNTEIYPSPFALARILWCLLISPNHNPPQQISPSVIQLKGTTINNKEILLTRSSILLLQCGMARTGQTADYMERTSREVNRRMLCRHCTLTSGKERPYKPWQHF